MKNTCKNCDFCSFKNTNVIGHSLIVSTYFCSNKNSCNFNNEMNIINNINGEKIDSLLNNSCDKIKLK